MPSSGDLLVVGTPVTQLPQGPGVAASLTTKQRSNEGFEPVVLPGPIVVVSISYLSGMEIARVEFPRLSSALHSARTRSLGACTTYVMEGSRFRFICRNGKVVQSFDDAWERVSQGRAA